MFIDTETTDAPNRTDSRPAGDALLGTDGRGRLRVYIGAAAGVGKTYRMLQDANQLNEQGIDVVLAAIETHRRFETE